MTAQPLHRDALWARLQQPRDWDLAVIGGGAVGLRHSLGGGRKPRRAGARLGAGQPVVRGVRQFCRLVRQCGFRRHQTVRAQEGPGIFQGRVGISDRHRARSASGPRQWRSTPGIGHRLHRRAGARRRNARRRTGHDQDTPRRHDALVR